ncbi:glutamate-1-semialdehyde 2,1-aminomutase [Gammaproteobacteria bacterium]|nr:glutamate-1-semialdehyde 2,1-aminomutase [Gammaproteobacteria bacterium]
MKRTKSNTIFEKTKKMIPGGVNSPVRSFTAVSSTPFIVKKSKGSLITDVDNNSYIDFIGSWGAMILGHSDNRILKKLNKVSKNGLTYGAPNVAETEIAEFIIKHIPSIDKIRMVNSGTEATMSAARLARGYTKKDIIIKFNGCYHGHGDAFLVEAGSGATTFGKPSSSGVTKGSSKDTISLPYNDKEAIKKIFSKYKNKIACVIIEPIAGNMNFVRSDKSFLSLIRKLCTQNNTLLIFDEVMTGFRVNFKGAQACYKIKPDLTTFGKVIGGGLPVGAFGGKSKIMDMLAPDGPIYQAGTLSGNPLAMNCGVETLKIISKKNFFKKLSTKTKSFADNLNKIATDYKYDFHADSEGGMFGLYFTNKKPKNIEDIKKSNLDEFNRFFTHMINNGVFFAPSAYEAGFMSESHTNKDLEKIYRLFKSFIKLAI